MNLKDTICEYVGTNKNTEEVTVELIVEVLAKEFPDFLFAVAQDNWIRGYHQALTDLGSVADAEKSSVSEEAQVAT